MRKRGQIAQADVLLARETLDFPQEAAYQAAELIELISRALESFNCASRCRRTIRCTQSYIFAVPQFATAPFCWIQFRLLWACSSLDFHLLGRLDYSAIFLPIISGIEHTPSHTYLFAPHLVALCIFFFAVPPAVVGRHSMPAIMIPGGFNSLTTQPWHYQSHASHSSFLASPFPSIQQTHHSFVFQPHMYHRPWPTDVVPVCLVLSALGTGTCSLSLIFPHHF